MKKIGNSCVLFLSVFFLGLWTCVAWSEDQVQVSVRVNPQTVVLGEPFVLTLFIQSSESVSIEEPELPSFVAFDLVGTWTSQSSSSHLVQGSGGMTFKTTRSLEYHYQLLPKKLGSNSIGSFKVVVEERPYQTKPVTVEVTQASSQNQNPSQKAFPSPQGGGLFEETDDIEEIFQQMLQRRHGLPPSQGLPSQGSPSQGLAGQEPFSGPKKPVIPPNKNDAFFIHLDIDKTDVYVGEQITVNWYLYTRGQILALDRLKFPDLKGFWKEIIEEVPALNFVPDVLDGVMYRRALLASHALFPIKEGVTEIDEYKVKATVQLPTQSFGGFGLSEPYSYQKSSNRIDVQVKAVPKQNQPQNFSGAVGFFEVKATVQNPSVPVNQPMAVKVRFEGQGNAKLIDLPPIQWPEGLEYFDQKSEARFFKNGQSFREFEILLIPRQNGDREIPALAFSFFNPVTGEYYVKQTDPIKITVTGNPQELPSDSLKVQEDPDSKSQMVASQKTKEIVIPTLLTDEEYEKVKNKISLGYIFYFLTLLTGLLGSLYLFKVIYFEGIKLNQKQTWKDFLEKRLKLLEKLDQKKLVQDQATVMSQTLSRLLGAVSHQKGHSYEFSKLLRGSPPSVQSHLGLELTKMHQSLESIAYSPKKTSQGLDEGDYHSKTLKSAETSDAFSDEEVLMQLRPQFKKLTYELLNYLESS
jgi:hypothetical protein